MLFNKLSVLFQRVELRPALFMIQSNISNSVKYFGILKNSSELTKDDEDTILNTINNCEANELEKYDIKAAQLKKLLTHRDKNGKFETFNDALMVQDVTPFIKFCNSILGGIQKDKTISKQRSSNATLTSKNLIIPPICKSDCIRSILGFHIWGNSLNWTLLEDNNRISAWNYENFDTTRKIGLLPMVDAVADVILQLPEADAYVMEADGYTALGKMKSSSYQFHLMRQQLMTTVISIIKMRLRRNEVEDSTAMKKFYMTQARLPAKFFKLNLGTEIISAKTIVTELMSCQKLAHFPQLDQVIIDPELVEKYKSQEFSIREQLNSALLLTLTFSYYTSIAQ